MHEYQLMNHNLEESLAANKNMFSKSTRKYDEMLHVWKVYNEGWKVKYNEVGGLGSGRVEQLTSSSTPSSRH